MKLNVKQFASCGLLLAVATCTQQQIDMAAYAACSALSIEAAKASSSPNPKVQFAVHGIQALCADPAATAAQVDAARVAFKNALKG